MGGGWGGNGRVFCFPGIKLTFFFFFKVKEAWLLLLFLGGEGVGSGPSGGEGPWGAAGGIETLVGGGRDTQTPSSGLHRRPPPGLSPHLGRPGGPGLPALPLPPFLERVGDPPALRPLPRVSADRRARRCAALRSPLAPPPPYAYSNQEGGGARGGAAYANRSC